MEVIAGQSAGQNDCFSDLLKNKIKTTSKGRFRLRRPFSGAITALQLPFLPEGFSQQNNKNQYFNT
ncbi:MAG: hypothetical protein ACLSB9_33085 [Hydrogeniiclostridium mannosilyticum]